MKKFGIKTDKYIIMEPKKKHNGHMMHKKVMRHLMNRLLTVEKGSAEHVDVIKQISDEYILYKIFIDVQIKNII